MAARIDCAVACISRNEVRASSETNGLRLVPARISTIFGHRPAFDPGHTHRLGDGLDGSQVIGGRSGEARLDDVDTESR